jgi:glycosyltransferase involved in cell wall biosynthesis
VEADQSGTYPTPGRDTVIRVLSVIHYPFFGGPQNQVVQLAKPLRTRGFSILAVLPDEPGNAFDRMAAADVDVIRMRLGRVRARLDWRIQRDSLLAIAGDVPRLGRLMRREQIDLVVVHGLVNPQGAIAARLRGRPVVWQIVDTRVPRALRIAFAPLVRTLASTVMTTGRAVADAHPGLPRDPKRLYPFFMPVDTQLFTPDDAEKDAVRAALGFAPDDVIVGCVANLTPQKGLERFLDVADRICESRTDVRFALFGSRMETHEDYAEQLLKRAADLQGRGRLVVLDVGADVPRHVRALDVFLATAVPRSEGISTTIVEAMSAGVPVVSTDVGAIREAVIHGETGYLVAPDNLPALVEYVIQLVDNHGQREAFAAAARARAVQEFDVERCADVHARAFEAALARHSR